MTIIASCQCRRNCKLPDKQLKLRSKSISDFNASNLTETKPWKIYNKITDIVLQIKFYQNSNVKY